MGRLRRLSRRMVLEEGTSVPSFPLPIPSPSFPLLCVPGEKDEDRSRSRKAQKEVPTHFCLTAAEASGLPRSWPHPRQPRLAGHQTRERNTPIMNGVMLTNSYKLLKYISNLKTIRRSNYITLGVPRAVHAGSQSAR